MRGRKREQEHVAEAYFQIDEHDEVESSVDPSIAVGIRIKEEWFMASGAAADDNDLDLDIILLSDRGTKIDVFQGARGQALFDGAVALWQNESGETVHGSAHIHLSRLPPVCAAVLFVTGGNGCAEQTDRKQSLGPTEELVPIELQAYIGEAGIFCSASAPVSDGNLALILRHQGRWLFGNVPPGHAPPRPGQAGASEGWLEGCAAAQASSGNAVALGRASIIGALPPAKPLAEALPPRKPPNGGFSGVENCPPAVQHLQKELEEQRDMSVHLQSELEASLQEAEHLRQSVSGLEASLKEERADKEASDQEAEELRQHASDLEQSIKEDQADQEARLRETEDLRQNASDLEERLTEEQAASQRLQERLKEEEAASQCLQALIESMETKLVKVDAQHTQNGLLQESIEQERLHHQNDLAEVTDRHLEAQQQMGQRVTEAVQEVADHKDMLARERQQSQQLEQRTGEAMQEVADHKDMLAREREQSQQLEQRAGEAMQEVADHKDMLTREHEQSQQLEQRAGEAIQEVEDHKGMLAKEREQSQQLEQRAGEAMREVADHKDMLEREREQSQLLQSKINEIQEFVQSQQQQLELKHEALQMSSRAIEEKSEELRQMQQALEEECVMSRQWQESAAQEKTYHQQSLEDASGRHRGLQLVMQQDNEGLQKELEAAHEQVKSHKQKLEEECERTRQLQAMHEDSISSDRDATQSFQAGHDSLGLELQAERMVSDRYRSELEGLHEASQLIQHETIEENTKLLADIVTLQTCLDAISLERDSLASKVEGMEALQSHMEALETQLGEHSPMRSAQEDALCQQLAETVAERDRLQQLIGNLPNRWKPNLSNQQLQLPSAEPDNCHQTGGSKDYPRVSPQHIYSPGSASQCSPKSPTGPTSPPARASDLMRSTSPTRLSEGHAMRVWTGASPSRSGQSLSSTSEATLSGMRLRDRLAGSPMVTAQEELAAAAVEPPSAPEELEIKSPLLEQLPGDLPQLSSTALTLSPGLFSQCSMMSPAFPMGPMSPVSPMSTMSRTQARSPLRPAVSNPLLEGRALRAWTATSPTKSVEMLKSGNSNGASMGTGSRDRLLENGKGPAWAGQRLAATWPHSQVVEPQLALSRRLAATDKMESPPRVRSLEMAPAPEESEAPSSARESECSLPLLLYPHSLASYALGPRASATVNCHQFAEKPQQPPSAPTESEAPSPSRSSFASPHPQLLPRHPSLLPIQDERRPLEGPGRPQAPLVQESRGRAQGPLVPEAPGRPLEGHDRTQEGPGRPQVPLVLEDAGRPQAPLLLDAGAALEGPGRPSKGSGRPHALFVLEGPEDAFPLRESMYSPISRASGCQPIDQPRLDTPLYGNFSTSRAGAFGGEVPKSGTIHAPLAGERSNIMWGCPPSPTATRLQEQEPWNSRADIEGLPDLKNPKQHHMVFAAAWLGQEVSDGDVAGGGPSSGGTLHNWTPGGALQSSLQNHSRSKMHMLLEPPRLAR